mgnify:CR=1 FL=1
MKKTITLFLLMLTLLILPIVNINASQEDIEKSKSATEEYCQDGKLKNGCVYDSNNTLYSESGTVKNENFFTYLSISNAKLTRGYQAVDADENIVFAGCYKAKVSGLVNWDDGDYYIFKIVKLSGNTCTTTSSDIVPPTGAKWHYLGMSGEYDGTNGIGSNMATYTEWTAENGGGCPLMFGLTANANFLTSTKNRYVFTDNQDGFKTDVYAFWGGEEYVPIPACTVNDVDGHKEAEECFTEASKKIDEYSCPSDLSKLTEMTNELEQYQTECKNKFKVLYSKGLLESDAEEFAKILKDKAREKINSCQYSKCNISQDQIEKINNAKSGKECSAGCIISSKEQSTSSNASCYCCGGAQGCSYTWTDIKPSSCSKVNKTKAQCVGSTKTDACLSCLDDAYKAAGLNETQRKCMKDLDIQISQTVADINDTIKDQFDDQIQKDLEENQKLRDEIEKLGTASMNLNALGFGTGSQTCRELLKPNLIKIIKLAMNTLRIVGAIIAIIKGMTLLIPPIINGEADKLKQAGRKCVKLGIVLLIIGVFPTIINFIGYVLKYDLSCITG